MLTLFGRVTGEMLPEGMHVINPLKTNNEMSIQTQTLKESASVPSSEGLVMNLDTSLIYHVDPYQGVGRLSEDRSRLRAGVDRAQLAGGDPRSYGLAFRQRALHRRA